jgi:hypothetical protein
MNPADLADATARALDLLPPDDPAATDPRFSRDARFVDEARHAREAAADVWLAVSPLRVAPPDVLQAVLAELAPPVSARPSGNQRLLPWLAAASGWAAAAVIAFSLWPGPSAEPAGTAVTARPVPTAPAPAQVSAPAPVSRESRLRHEITRLQSRLAEVRPEDPARSPRVLRLSAPGAARRSPEQARHRVREILTGALRSALEAESGAPSDPAALVIERGWPAGGPPVPANGDAIRHRHFPEQSWQELGLKRSENGDYFDPATQVVWTPDPDNRGFLGRKITDDDDPARFKPASESHPPPPDKPRTIPEGFVIENPAEKSTEVVIDEMPPPAEGTERFVVWTDTLHATTTVPLSELPAPDGQMANASVASGSIIFTIPNSKGITSLQIIERPTLPTGQPELIILGSDPP